jgi:hypothetical protein
MEPIKYVSTKPDQPSVNDVVPNNDLGGTHYVRAKGEVVRIRGFSNFDNTRGFPGSYSAYGWVERAHFIQHGIFDSGDPIKGQWRTLFEMISIYQR